MNSIHNSPVGGAMFDHDDVIYDDKNHKMLFWQMNPNEFKLMKEISCHKCNSNIDVTMGYYSCEICFQDLCKNCANMLYGKEISFALSPREVEKS